MWGDLHFLAPLQDQNAQFSTFLHRTDILAARMNLRVEDIPSVLGMSRRTLFACRSANSAITPKSWLKLESAERAAGIVPPGETGNAGSSADPKQSPASPGEKLPGQEDPFSLQSQIDAIRLHLTPFTLAELESRMTAASAWPATAADRHLTPAQLWQKYAPA
jgi:hypothetical protein